MSDDERHDASNGFVTKAESSDGDDITDLTPYDYSSGSPLHCPSIPTATPVLVPNVVETKKANNTTLFDHLNVDDLHWWQRSSSGRLLGRLCTYAGVVACSAAVVYTVCKRPDGYFYLPEVFGAGPIRTGMRNSALLVGSVSLLGGLYLQRKSYYLDPLELKKLRSIFFHKAASNSVREHGVERLFDFATLSEISHRVEEEIAERGFVYAWKAFGAKALAEMLRLQIISTGELALQFESDATYSRLVGMLELFDTFGPFLVHHKIVHPSRLRELLLKDATVQSLTFEEAAKVDLGRLIQLKIVSGAEFVVPLFRKAILNGEVTWPQVQSKYRFMFSDELCDPHTLQTLFQQHVSKMTFCEILDLAYPWPLSDHEWLLISSPYESEQYKKLASKYERVQKKRQEAEARVTRRYHERVNTREHGREKLKKFATKETEDQRVVRQTLEDAEDQKLNSDYYADLETVKYEYVEATVRINSKWKQVKSRSAATASSSSSALSSTPYFPEPSAPPSPL
eukprot:CAMPEP_0177678092 /NCGR_PEP_ID=MMETSP0447-20121125/28814_1 /TAXON_ID=0 /ORGANISM="Stygamoeba regulata, Strain BSH-02190019" /LENGTH=511 /DNA_ID=CAMNT_0019187051 /DNA_START=35 /DNA_END=1570 /DNA_ORIENTATION=-